MIQSGLLENALVHREEWVVPVGGELIGSSESIDGVRGVGINGEGSCSSSVHGRSREIISEGDEIEAGCMNGSADG
jgi:hypothetical protein